MLFIVTDPLCDSTLGAQLATLRRRRRLSQRSLVPLAGTTRPTLSKLERESTGRLDVLDRVPAILGAGPVLAANGSTPAFYAHAGNSSGHHAWKTPGALLESLYQVFGRFDLDPCSPTKNARRAPVRARVHFTLDDDGLSLPWHGTVFLNPPYGRTLGQWIQKAHEETAAGNAETVVALIPARTDTRWWYQHVAPHAAVFFLQGRLSFDDAGQSAPFPSALAVWEASHTHLAAQT